MATDIKKAEGYEDIKPYFDGVKGSGVKILRPLNLTDNDGISFTFMSTDDQKIEVFWDIDAKTICMMADDDLDTVDDISLGGIMDLTKDTMANEAKTKVNKLSFKPVGAMIKDYKEAWDTKALNRESKLVPGGDWVDVETGGDSDMMVCVTPEMKKKLPKGENGDAIFVMAAYGDLMWDQDKKDFVAVATNNAGEEKAFWLQGGEGGAEIAEFMNESKANKSKVPVLESFSSMLKPMLITEAEAEDSDGNILQEGDPVEVDAAYGGGRGTVVDTSHGSFVIVEIGGKNHSYHASNLTLIEDDEEEEDDEDMDNQYEYIIDLDERGDFRAHVEDQYGNSVFEIDGLDDLNSIIEDGFMSDKNDTDGLLDHLTDLEILPKDAVLEGKVMEGNDTGESFKDTKGKTPKVGDFIVHDDGNVGKVKSFSTDKDGGRMKVDFRGHYLELNPKSKFEIIEPDEKLKKAFESKVTDKAKKQKEKPTNAQKDGLKGLKKEVESHYKEKGTQPADNITAMGKDQIGEDMEKFQKRQPKPEYTKPKDQKGKKK